MELEEGVGVEGVYVVFLCKSVSLSTAMTGSCESREPAMCRVAQSESAASEICS